MNPRLILAGLLAGAALAAACTPADEPDAAPPAPTSTAPTSSPSVPAPTPIPPVSHHPDDRLAAYAQLLRDASGQWVTISDAQTFARGICGTLRADTEAGAPDPAGRMIDELANIPGAPAKAPDVIIPATIEYGCPDLAR